MAQFDTPRVPIQTPMFHEWEDGSGPLNVHRTWIIFWERLYTAAAQAAGGPYVRTLLLKDTTVGNRITDSVPIWVTGTGTRVIGVLRKTIASNLTVRFNKAGVSLGTFTIPSATAIDTSVYLTAGIAGVAFTAGEVLSADVTASDGQTDVNGVASFTLEWS